LSEALRSQFVVDTHALVWLLIDPDRVSPAANAAFQRLEAGLADLWPPTIALAELVSVARKHQLPLRLSAVLDPARLGSAARVADLTSRQ
jgi:PIN domain nuclease of toxin-antitoxin system